MSDQMPVNAFYANFPGFSNQEQHKQHLANDRKHEYQQYLQEKAAKEQVVHDRKIAANIQYRSDNADREQQQQHDDRQSMWEEAQLNREDEAAANKTTAALKHQQHAEEMAAAAPMTPRPRAELLHNLRHTDLPGHSSNPDAVHTRNQEDADVSFILISMNTSVIINANHFISDGYSQEDGIPT